MRLLLSLVLLISIIPVKAAQQMGSSDHGAELISHINQDGYEIQLDNEISFTYKKSDGTVTNYPKVPMFPNGMLIVPELGEVNVIGQTSSDLKELVKAKLGQDTEVEIFIYRVPNNVSVLGQIKNPGSYTHRDIKTVYDAIAKAGGFTKVANKEKVQLIRQKVDGTRVSYIIDFPKEVFKAYEPGQGVGQEIYLLQEGDLIYVPASKPKQVGYFTLRALNVATMGVLTGVFTGIVSSAVD